MVAHVDPGAPRLEVQGTMRVRMASAAPKTAQVTLSGIMQDAHIDVVEPQAFAGPLVRTVTSDTSTWTAQLPSTLAAGQEVVLRFICSTRQADHVVVLVTGHYQGLFRTIQQSAEQPHYGCGGGGRDDGSTCFPIMMPVAGLEGPLPEVRRSGDGDEGD